MQREVEKYRKPTRILHWIHAGAFVLLYTGYMLVPLFSFFSPVLSSLSRNWE